jgi:hypothetical protein
MKSIAERPPILTVHEDSGDYILRVGDTRYRSLVVGVSKLLTDARRLIVVTPGDVKFFVMGDGDGSSADDSTVATDSDSGGSTVSEEVIAEQESHALPNAEPEDAEPILKTVRKRKPLNPDVRVGHTENCQRCAGSGKTSVLMPDNSAAETACPICRGEGQIKRYGSRRS